MNIQFNFFHQHSVKPNYIIHITIFIFPSDIDECEQGSDGCDHNCTNTVGSYYCTCMDGYELESDNQTCTGNKHILDKY